MRSHRALVLQVLEVDDVRLHSPVVPQQFHLASPWEAISVARAYVAVAGAVGLGDAGVGSGVVVDLGVQDLLLEHHQAVGVVVESHDQPFLGLDEVDPSLIVDLGLFEFAQDPVVLVDLGAVLVSVGVHCQAHWVLLVPPAHYLMHLRSGEMEVAFVPLLLQPRRQQPGKSTAT